MLRIVLLAVIQLEAEIHHGVRRRELYTLLNRGEHQSQIADPLPDFAAILLRQQLWFGVPSRHHGQLEGLVADLGHVVERLAYRDCSHAVKTEAQHWLSGFSRLKPFISALRLCQSAVKQDS